MRLIPIARFECGIARSSFVAYRGGDLPGAHEPLAIARGHVTRPKLVVLDEPTGGIQPSIIHEIERVIGLLRDRGDRAFVLVESSSAFARAFEAVERAGGKV